MPARLLRLARDAAAQAGFADFVPDACLIHRYLPDARMSLHQDRDERDRTAPIGSVSLGLPAVFRWGGLKRKDPTGRLPLAHGDMRVWGGPDRLRDRGVLPLEAGHHAALGNQRINLTFRRAGLLDVGGLPRIPVLTGQDRSWWERLTGDGAVAANRRAEGNRGGGRTETG